MKKTEVLQKIPLFQNLRVGDLESLAKIAVEVKYKANQQIFAEGDVGDSLFIIETGSVRVLKKEPDGRNEEVASLGPGQHFGEMSLIDEKDRSATLVAAENTKLIRIHREDWEKLLGQNFPLAYQVYRGLTTHLCNRLRHTTQNLISMIEQVNLMKHFNYFPEGW